jgi:hypothetical protein
VAGGPGPGLEDTIQRRESVVETEALESFSSIQRFQGEWPTLSGAASALEAAEALGGSCSRPAGNVGQATDGGINSLPWRVLFRRSLGSFGFSHLAAVGWARSERL